jgi:mannan endo-1,4-beta-mannosidase
MKAMRLYDSRLAYVLVWRNDVRSATHYYAPVPDHPSVPDFIKFFEDPYTLFEKDLKGIYK